MRRGFEQHFAFAQGFAHQPELVVFEVTQSTVDQLGAGGRGRAGEIASLHGGHRKAAPGGVARDADPVDPATDDEEIAHITAVHAPNLLSRARTSRRVFNSVNPAIASPR